MSRYFDIKNRVLGGGYDDEEERRRREQEGQDAMSLYSQYAKEAEGASRYEKIRDKVLSENNYYPDYAARYASLREPDPYNGMDAAEYAQQARRNAESAAAFAQQASNKDQHMQHLKDQVQLASEIRGGDYSHMNEFNRLHNGDQGFNPVRGRDAHEELKKKTREDALDVLDEYYARKQYGDDEYDRMQAAMPQMQKRYDELDKKLHVGEELPPEIQAAKDRLDEAERTGEGYDPMDMDEDMRIVSEYRMENPKKSGLTQEEEYEYNQLSMDLLSYGERAALDKIAELSDQLSNISNVNGGAYMQEQQKKNQQLQAQIDEQAEILKEYGWDDKKINEYRLRGERLLHREKAKEEKAIIPIDENDSALVKGIKSVGDYTLARVANMTAPLSVMSNFEESPEGQGRDPYSSWGAPRRAAQLSDQEVLDKVIGEDNTIGRMAYSAAASAGDAAIVMLATKGAGELFGVAGAGMALETAEKAGTATAAMRHAATAEKVIQNLFMAPYIASGYESGYEEARANGASEEGAQLRGFISGFAEYATEKVSLDNLWEIANGTKAGRNILVNLFVSAGIEGSEEVASNVINEWADAAISAALKDKKSDYQQRVDDYLAQGYSEEEANKKAAAEKVAEYMYDGMVGAMSGGMMGVGAAARGYSVANENKQRSKEVSEYYGKQAENITGSTEYEQGSKAQAEKYAQNPTQYLADSIDDTTKAGREAKELIQEYADKEAEGKRLSASDRADIERALYEADAASQLKDRSSMDVYEGYTRELQQVPKEYRTASTGITEEQARTRLVEAAKSGDLQGLSDTYQAMKNAMSPDLREHADEIYKQYYGMAENNGVSEQQLNALKQTPQDAYLAGLKGESRESLGAISTVAAEAYNAGAQQRIRNNTFQVDKADSLKTVKLSDGNTRSLSGQFDAEGDIVTADGTVSIASIENDSVREAYKRASAQPTAAAQQAYIENIKDGTNLHSYDIAFNNLYRAGVTGVSFDRAKKDLRVYISGLGEDMSRSIFDTGASDYRAEISRKASDGVRSAFKMRKGSGAFQDLRQGAKADIDTRVMDLTAKATGLNVVLIDATGDNRQAWFDAKASTIYVTEDHAVQLIHEMGEFAEIYAPEEYEQLRGAVMAASENMLGSAGYQSMIDNYYQAYKNVEADKTVLEASEEATNDMLVALMSTDKGQQALAKYLTEKLGVKEAKTVGQKIKDFFQGIVNSMKSLLNSSKLNSYQKKMLDAKIAEEEELIDSFIKTLDKAIENYQSTQENVSGTETDARYSIDVDGLDVKTNEAGDIAYIGGHEVPIIKERMFTSRDVKKDGKTVRKLLHEAILEIANDPERRNITIKEDNHEVIIDKGTAQESVYAEKNRGELADRAERIKYNALPEIIQMIENAYDKNYVADQNGKHKTKAARGWNYYTCDIVMHDSGDQYSMWRGRLNVRLDADGNDYVYDITRIEEVPHDRIVSASQDGSTSSNVNVSQAEAESKKNFSLSVDSEGNELSKGQQEYFKDSKVRDEEGKLLVLYHGTNADFTVFDRTKARANMDINGHFFSPWEIDAQGYGEKVKAYYLNIKNPASAGVGYKALNMFKGQNNAGVKAREYLESLGYDGVNNDNEEYIAFYPNQIKEVENKTPTDNPDIRYSMNIDDTLQYLDSLVDPKRSSGFNNTIRFLGVTRSQETMNFYMDSAREMLGRGTISQEEYDLLDAFSMKKRMALMKQDSPEARYSLDIDEDWESEFWSQPAPEEKVGGVKLSELGSILQDGMTELMGQIVDEKKVREIATKLRTEVGSTIKVNEFSDMLMKAFAYMQAQDHVDYADVMRIFNEIARPVVDQITTIDEGAQYAYDNFVDALKGQKIRLTSKQEAEVKNAYGNLANFRRATMPLDFSRKGTIDLDSLWPSLVDELGGLIDADAAEGDQPLIIADTLASLRPSPVNPYGMNTEEYARDLAMRIVEEYLGMQAGNEARGAAKKFAEKGKQYRERVRNRYEERFKEAKAQLREKVRDQILKIQDDNIEKMAELRARNRKDAQRIRDAVEIRHQKEMITKKAKKLATWVMDPTDKNHVPQELQEPVLEFLYALDFVEPDVIYKKGDPQGEYQAKILNHTIIDEFGRRHLVFDTIKADTREGAIWEFYNRLHAGMGSQAQRSWTERMQRLQDLLNRVKGGDQFEHADMDSIAQMFDTDLADELADMLARNRGKASINSLSVKEFQLLNKALDHIAHAIDNSNKAITMNEEIEGLAVNTITHAQALKQPKNHSSAYNKITKNIGVDMMTPETFFALQGDSGEKIYHALTDALNRKILDVKETEAYMKEALRKVNKKDMRKMRREVHSFNVHDGVIELTTAQIMSMYELNKRDQAVLHYRGGVKADTVRVKNKGITHEQNQSRAVHLSPFDIAEIVGILTDEQKALADKMQKFLAGRCAEWGNEASLKMYGYQKFEDPNYFPITTDKSTIAKNNANTSKQSLNGIEHMGMTKKVNEFAKNPILIRDIFDVFTDHITDMAAYHGYAPVVKDANRWFNYKEIFPENGRDDGGFLDYVTVQQAINTNIGRTDNEGVNYYTKLVQDINGQEKSGEISTFWDSLIGNYKAAAVAGNLRVVIQQPTAFMRAFNMINPKYMIASLPSAVTAGKNIKRIKELSPIAWWKSQGYYESSMGKSVASIVTGEESIKDQIVDKSMWLAGKADDITWSILYKAVEKEQKAKAKGEDISEEEYRRRVNDRFDDVIAQTQVVDVTIQKSQWMRATGGLTKMRTAFMAEPTKSYNMALKAIIEDHRTYGNNIAKWKSVRKAAVVLLLTDMLTSIAQSLMDAIRYKDDDDEYLDLLVDYFQSNMIDNINPLNRIPGLKDVSDSLWSAFLGESKYGSSSGQSFDAASTEAAIEAISTFSKQMQGTYSKTGYAAYMSYTKALSRITGIPLYNISRDGAAFWNLFAEGDNRLIKNIPKPSDKYQGIYNALDRGKSDEALYAAIDKAMNENGTVKSAESFLQSKYKQDYLDLLDTNPDAAEELAEEAVRAYMGLGLTRPEAEEEIESWSDPSYGYSVLDKAIENKDGEGIEDAVRYLQEAKDDDKIIEHVLKAYGTTINYNRKHKAGTAESTIEQNVNRALKTVDRSIDFDSAYRDQQLKEKEKAEKKAAQAEKKAAQTTVYETITTGSGDYKAAVDAWAREGVDASSMKSSLTSDQVKPAVKAYKQGDRNAQQTLVRIATTKAYIDQQSGLEIPKKYGGDYYTYELDQITKMMDKYDKEPW